MKITRARLTRTQRYSDSRTSSGRIKSTLLKALLVWIWILETTPGLPDRGMRLFASHNNGLITSNDNSNYGQTFAFIEHYSTLQALLPVTLGLRVGGGGSYGDIPFYKQFSLGQNTYLRVFRRNRFTGDAMLFLDSELWLQLLEVSTTIVPLRIGIKGFFDTGKIIQSGESSDKWHNGYGFGIFIVPLKERFTLSASVGFSSEETALLRIGLGSVF